MNIQDATTEPFYLFIRAHESLGRNVRIAYGALHALTEQVGSMVPDKITLPTGDEPWGKTTSWRGLNQRIPFVRRFISHMGLVLAASAFENFVTNVISEYNRYCGFSGIETPTTGPSADDTVGGDSLRNLYASAGWDINAVKFLLPLYDYFILARNCIVHRSGRASEKFVEQAQLIQLRESIETWPSKRRIPQLPLVQKGDDITLFPRHAILFSEVCHRAAVDINGHLCDFFGVEGTVLMAAYHGLLADNRVHTNARRSPEQIINRVLTERFHVSDLDKFEVVPILKKLNKWKQCRNRYMRLYPDVKYS